MQRFGKFVAAMSLVCAVGFVQAQNVTGAWKGKIVVDMSKQLPKGKDEAQQKQMEAMKKRIEAMVSNAKVSLNLKADKTFSMTITGLQMPQAGGKPAKAQSAEGTWSMKGTVITMNITKANGEAPKNKPTPQNINVLEGGKKLELVNPVGGKIVFVR